MSQTTEVVPRIAALVGLATLTAAVPAAAADAAKVRPVEVESLTVSTR